MRRLLLVLAGVMALVGVGGTAANAEPASPEPAPAPLVTHVTKKMTVNPKFAGTVEFTSTDSKNRQDPPGGGCDYGDVSGTLNYTYVNGALSTLEAEWSAKVLCQTTAPGQSMGQININSSLWHNGSGVGTGTPFACSNCNLGNSVGDWVCVGVTCAGSYWVGAIVRLTLPAGWAWVTPSPGCTIPSERVLQCVPTSGTVTVPATD
jgi:hypothetical protein